MSTKIFKITRRVYRSPLRGINQNARVGTHEEMENAQNRLLRRNTTNRWTGTQFMGIYGSIVYGYLWQYCLWIFMVVQNLVYGFGEPFWCIQRYIRGRETENIYFGGERKRSFRGRNIYQKHSSILSSLPTLFEGEDTFSLPPPLPLYNLTRATLYHREENSLFL